MAIAATTYNSFVTNVIQNANFNPQIRKSLSLLLAKINVDLLAAGTTQGDLTAISTALIAGGVVSDAAVTSTPIPTSNNNPTA